MAMMMVAKNIEPKPCDNPEIPARIMAGDDRPDAERPERPDACVALQASCFEIGFVNCRIGDARSALRACGRGVNPGLR